VESSACQQIAQASPGSRVLAIDADEGVLAKARERCAPLGERLRIRHAFADASPIGDETVEAVLCSLLLHHLVPSSKSRALAEFFIPAAASLFSTGEHYEAYLGGPASCSSPASMVASALAIMPPGNSPG
jgi:methyltransferase family protein